MIDTLELAPITSAVAWRGPQIAQDPSWIYVLDGEELAELETVGRRFLDDDPDLRTVSADDYPLPILAPALRAWSTDIEDGRGFVLVRGLKVQHYSDALSAAIFFVMGLHMGQPMRQNEAGDLIQHVLATSDKPLSDPTASSVRIRDRLNYHSDSSDIVALMCLRPAREGGASSIISSAAIHNEVLARRPDLAPLLFEPWHTDWLRQDPEAPANTYVTPMMCLVDGVFSAYIGTRLIRTAQDYPEAPRLTDRQVELLDLIDEICADLQLPLFMDFRPGDVQWLLNYVALHSRTAFKDHPEPGRQRHLLRLWLRTHEPRKLAPRFGRSVVIGRNETRGAEPPVELQKFHITQAALPRLEEPGPALKGATR